jgi:hypothetical protein
MKTRTKTRSVHRLVVLGMLMSGCHEWVPATSLADIHDETVRISTSESTVTLEHANAHGTVIEGTPITEGGRFEVSAECAPPECHRVDVKSADVHRRRIDGAATAGVVALSLVGAVMTFFGGAMLVAFAALGNMK